MRKTKAIYGAEAREKLYAGVKQVFDAVAPTLGARGRNGVFERYGSPINTNDGVSLAREIIPEDPFEYLGAESIKQASEETNRRAGDGTTSTVVFGHELIGLGMEAIDNGYDAMKLKLEIEDAAKESVDLLKKASRECVGDDLLSVARVSVENENIATLVAGIVEKVGPFGSIIVEEGSGYDIEVDTVKGFWWDKGYVSPYMSTNEKGEAVLEDCAVMITDRYMNLNKDFFQALQELNSAGYRSVLLIAENIEGELLQTIIANKMKGNINVVAVRRPASVEALEDIAILTNAIAVTKEKGIKDMGVQHSGKAHTVIVTAEKTIIVGNQSEKLDERIAEIQAQIAELGDETYGPIEALKERLARLLGGLAIIRVGAKTDAERSYLKLKVDDAVGACKAALEEGIVAGGGTMLRDIANTISQNSLGAQIFAEALRSPYLQILLNAGMLYTPKTWIFGGEKMVDTTLNYNVLTGEIIDDMHEAGIVDPTKVARCVIEHGASAAKTLLTTECVIAQVPEVSVPSKQGQRQ